MYLKEGGPFWMLYFYQTQKANNWLFKPFSENRPFWPLFSKVLLTFYAICDIIVKNNLLETLMLHHSLWLTRYHEFHLEFKWFCQTMWCSGYTGNNTHCSVLLSFGAMNNMNYSWFFLLKWSQQCGPWDSREGHRALAFPKRANESMKPTWGELMQRHAVTFHLWKEIQWESNETPINGVLWVCVQPVCQGFPGDSFWREIWRSV